MIKTTLHAQGWEPWLLSYLARSGARWIKFVNAFPVIDGISILGRVRSMSEDESNVLVSKGEQGAVDYYKTVRGEMDKNRHVKLWEGPNEVAIWLEWVLAGYHDFYQKLIELYHADGFPIAAGQFNVGYPFLPSDDGGRQSEICGRAIQGADAVTFHEYDPVDLRASTGYKALRYQKTIAYWRSLGLVVPPVFISELGLDDNTGSANFGHDGWKTITADSEHPDGNLDLYIEQLCWYEQKIQADPDVMAATIFSVVTNWDDFALDETQCVALADALRRVETSTRARGLDVNQFSGEITDWNAIKDNFDWIAIRASGPNADRTAIIKDRQFENNYAGAGSVGLPRLVYHGLHPDFTGQPALFTSTVAGRLVELGYYADLELKLTDAKCAEFLSAVDSTLINKGLEKCGIYTNLNFMLNHIGYWAEGRRLWIAGWVENYNDKMIPVVPRQFDTWEFWQYTNQGYVNGVPKRVCLDVYNGTKEKLYDSYNIDKEEEEENDMWNSVGFANVTLENVTRERFDSFWGKNMKLFRPANLPVGSVYYKLTKLSWREGWCGLALRVIDEGGNPIVGEQVFQGWDNPEKKLPDDVAPVGGQPTGYPNTGNGGFTNTEGVHGWGWGEGEWFDPTKVEGPHWYWRGGENGAYSDVACGFGWWDEHEVLEPTFMRTIVTDDNNGDDEPEYEEILDALLAIATDVHDIREWLYRD